MGKKPEIVRFYPERSKAQPAVTLRTARRPKTGSYVRINGAAAEEFDLYRFKSVTIWADLSTHEVPVFFQMHEKKDVKGAYSLTRASNEKNLGLVISATKLAERLGLEVNKSHRFSAEWDEDEKILKIKVDTLR